MLNAVRTRLSNQVVRSRREQAIVIGLIGQGVSDENKLTDAVFYDRHPEWRGKSLQYGSRALGQEWLDIRDAVVRPLLVRPFSTPKLAGSVQTLQPAAPAAAAPRAPQKSESFGYSTFKNIAQYQPHKIVLAFAAQSAYQKVSGFLPWYKKINTAMPAVTISLASHGVGNLVFTMDKRAFTGLVESQELKNKVLETIGGAASDLVFGVDVIGYFGLGLTLLEIARGLENERKLGGFGPDHDAWLEEQKRHFICGLLAEDLARTNFGDGYFFSRSSRDLAVELEERYKEFRPIFFQYQQYFWLDEALARSQSSVPQYQGPTMGPA